jgi:hypothetical protein
VGVDLEPAAGHLDPLLHGDQAEVAGAVKVGGGLGLEADAVVADLEVDPVVGEDGQALDGSVVQLGATCIRSSSAAGTVRSSTRRRSASARSITRTSPAMRVITSTNSTAQAPATVATWRTSRAGATGAVAPMASSRPRPRRGLPPPGRLGQPGHRGVQPGRAQQQVGAEVQAVGDGRRGAAEGEDRGQRVGGHGHGQVGDEELEGGRAPPGLSLAG